MTDDKDWSLFQYKITENALEWEDPQFKIRGLIQRGPYCFCAYVGVPLDNPAAGLGEELSLPVHFGVTFAAEGDGQQFAKGYYWYGWDYAHAGDLVVYYDHPMASEFAKLRRATGKAWDVPDIRKDVEDAIAHLNREITRAVLLT